MVPEFFFFFLTKKEDISCGSQKFMHIKKKKNKRKSDRLQDEMYYYIN